MTDNLVWLDIGREKRGIPMNRPPSFLAGSESGNQMSDGGLILPEENVKIDWKLYSIRIDFYPSIKLTRKDGLKFAESITEYLEPDDVQPGSSTEWKFFGGAICEGIELRIGKQSIWLSARNPSNNLEWYEHRFTPILEVFAKTFSPQVALHCNVVVSGLIAMPGETDARSFLGGYVMMIHPHKLAPIDRTLHVLGVRLYFPQTTKDESENSEDVDWSVDVRIESSMINTKKLFLEADADWEPPETWDLQFIPSAVNRLSIVSAFMSEKLIKFIRQPPFPDDDDEEEDDVNDVN